MDAKLKILILEDVPTDAELVERELRKGGLDFVSMRVDTKEAFVKELRAFSPDIILSDFKLPSFDGFAALAISKKARPDAPFIFVSGAIGEEAAIETLKKGATDYVLKDRLSRLVPAVNRALDEAKEHLERKKAEEALIRRDYQLEILSRTSQHVNMVLEVPVIMRTLVAAAMELVGAAGGTAGLLVNGKMVFKEYNNKGSLETIRYSFKPGHGVSGWVINTKKPYISNDAVRDPQLVSRMRDVYKIYNLVNVPIICSSGEHLGCFEIHNKENRQSFDTQDVFMLQGLAASAAVALENAMAFVERKRIETRLGELNKEILKSNRKLKQFALKDSQTGLYNHRYLSEFIESELYRAKRYGSSISAMMIDIDYFKSINDLYGREFGDLVLKQFAAYLKRTVRRYDIIIRFGGEEFVIISSGVDRFRAMALGQRFLEATSLVSFGNKKHTVKLRLSIAVVAYPDDNVKQGIDLINIADRILNKVKEDGGSRVYSSQVLSSRSGRKADRKASKSLGVRALEEKVKKLTARGKQSVMESIFAFAKTIELRDQYTGDHVENTVRFATEIAKGLDLSADEIEKIRQAAVLHDLGKIGISDKILHKKSKLTEKEFAEIRKHPQIAADIIRPIQFMHDIIPLVLYHHERWDGSGYTGGLSGEEIPIGARIIALADVYQALTSDRPYRKAYSKKKAIEIIESGAGTQFDPKIVKVFMGILRNGAK